MPTLRLPCNMTDAEKIDTGAKLTAANQALKAAQDAKKAAASEHGAAVKTAQADVDRLTNLSASGVIRRDVEVETRMDPEGTLRTYRLDTEPPEVVATETMDPDERQIGLGLDGPTAEQEQADEQRDAATPEEAEEMREARLSDEQRERVEAQADELLAQVAVEEHTSTTPGAPPSFFVAKADGGTWTMEADGETEEAARVALREKLVAKLTADAAEVSKLAAEQAADAARDKPKRGLKAPKKGPKPRTYKRTKHVDVDPDGEPTPPAVPPSGDDPEAPPLGADGTPLVF